MPTYYRVHYSREHLADWAEGKRTSFHHWVRGSWMDVWIETRSLNPDDYPVAANLTEAASTEAARQAFLSAASKNADISTWSEDAVRAAGELDGLCAFETPSDLVKWYEKTAFPERIVAFDGAYVCPLPDGDGSVLARYYSEVQSWVSLEEFKHFFGV